MSSKGKIWIWIIIAVILVAAGYFIWQDYNHNLNNSRYSKSQQNIINDEGTGYFVFNDLHENFTKKLYFFKGQAKTNYGTDDQNSVVYKIKDVLQPFNLDQTGENEYPLLLEADYSDGTKLVYLAVAHKDTNDTFDSVDQVIVGKSDQVDDVHNYNQKELLLDTHFTDNAGNRENAILSYTFKDNKIIPNPHNIDLANPPKPQIKSVVTPTPAVSNNTKDLNNGSGKNGTIALSFDDGPGVYTSQILDVLAKEGVNATFFEIGQNADAHPDITRQVREAGHEIEDHTYTHPDLSKLSSDAQSSEISKGREAIKNILSSYVVSWLRPPYGSYNDDTVNVLGQLGLKKMLWNVDTRDWSGISADDIYNAAIAGARDGAIILMHDGVANSNETAAALPRIIDTLRSQGYKMVKLSEMNQ